MKYVHTNLVSKDWKSLASFYIQVFDCKLLLPQRDLSGDWLSKATGVPNAHIKGAHLRLPGHGKNGPTLEIFQYDRIEEKGVSLSNRRGLGHLAFEVNNVQEVVEKAMKFGAIPYGQIATKEISGLGILTFVYIKDPEGNIIEIQNWGKTVEMPIQNDNQELILPTQNDTVVTVQENKNPIPDNSKKENPVTTVDNSNGTNKDNSNNNSNENKEKKTEQDPDAPKSKRELLDELQKDLDNAKQGIIDAKRELKYTKEDAQFIAKKTAQNINKEDVTPNIQKTKQELLEELKKEMMLAEDKIAINLNTNLTPETKNENKTTEQPVAKTELIKTPPKLKVEIKSPEGLTRELNLQNLSLVKTTTEIAQNLRCFTTMTRPEEHNLLFIEWICKAFKADLVPLLQQYKTNQSKEQNDNAWAMTPRLRDSLRHLLGKCQEEPEVVVDLKVQSIGLAASDFVLTYKDLLNIILEAEKEGALFVRLHYSEEAV